MRNISLKVVLIAAALAGVSAACGELDEIATYDPVTDPGQLFMAITLNHHAINLAPAAPYDQLQLIATPRNARGEALTGLPPVTYRSSDTTRLFVTQDGLLTARRSGTNLSVIAEIVTSDNIRRADTAWVNISSSTTPPQIASFEIGPVPPAPAEWAINPTTGLLGNIFLSPSGIDLTPRLPVRALNESGTAVTGLQISYESLDPTIATISRRFGGPGLVSLGEARIVASTFAYGVSLSDTVVYTVTWPRVHGFQLRLEPDSTVSITTNTVVISPGGYVFWSSMVLTPTSITFDNPDMASEIPEVCARFGGEMCGGGNIGPFDFSAGLIAGIRGRQFNTPGTVNFQTSTGITGRVIVADDETI